MSRHKLVAAIAAAAAAGSLVGAGAVQLVGRRSSRQPVRPSPVAAVPAARPVPSASPTPGPTHRATSGPPLTGRVPRPPIVWMPIPFPPSRLAQMAAYAQLHYGIDSWHIVGPHVIVEHYTGSTTFSSAYNTFAQDVPDTEFHVLPNVCAHFIVDTDGTIYQLVHLDVMCRHTVGLDWTALGIEHVGTSDQQILDNPRQLSASLHLTLWLMQRFDIPLGDVIGHNESLTSPYHRELVASWRCQTHQDWLPADMAVYRADLAALARQYGVPLGPPVPRVPTSCG